MIFTKENLIDMLRNNIVTVTFTKVNGEERMVGVRFELIASSRFQWDKILNNEPAALPFGVRFVAQRWLFL